MWVRLDSSEKVAEPDETGSLQNKKPFLLLVKKPMFRHGKNQEFQAAVKNGEDEFAEIQIANPSHLNPNPNPLSCFPDCRVLTSVE